MRIETKQLAMSPNKPWKKSTLFPLCKRWIEVDFRIYTTCLLLIILTVSPVAQAGELGRLFYTPQQRQQMDYHIVGGMEQEVNRNYIVVNGVVQKQGGKRTVWVNGTEQADGPSAGRNPANAAVTPPGRSGTVYLKVGEKLLLDEPAPPESRQQGLAKPATDDDD